MGRRKIEIKPIKDDRNRQVTFLKRKGGLFKKAHELSVLCNVDIAVIIFGANKKLYQFSSADVQEIISRHSYYENAHEHKGPADFQAKTDAGDDDDDDDVDDVAIERESSVLHHLHGPPGLPQMHNRQHTASASPPIPPKNLVGGGQYHQMPQMAARTTPQPMSRPNSRNQRRNSSNLVPQNAYPAPQAPQQQNGYTGYGMPNPSVYNPQPTSVMAITMQQAQSYQNFQQQQQQQQQQTQAQAQAQAQGPVFMNDGSRRQSMPPTFPSERHLGPDSMPPDGQRVDTHAGVIPKRAPAKSRSMFTPIGPSESLLAQHFSYGDRVQEPQRSHSVDVATLSRPSVNTTVPEIPKTENHQESSPKPAHAIPPTNHQDSIPPPPSRTNSMVSNSGKPGARPRLKVQIPSEHSDAGSATAESSAQESSGTTGNHSAKGMNEGSHGNGAVLPPPSPSVGTLLSAGATGPVNPFARPPPTTGPTEQTPISALPSRFVDHGLLPSPSVFYADWPGYTPRPNSDNVLPSPINFTTPVVGTSNNIFKDPPDANSKRKSPSSPDHEEDGILPSFQKRVKT